MPRRTSNSSPTMAASPAASTTVSRAGLPRMSMSHNKSSASISHSHDMRERDLESRAGHVTPPTHNGNHTSHSPPSDRSHSHVGMLIGTSHHHPPTDVPHAPSFSDTSDNIRTRTEQLSNLLSPQDKASALRRSFSTASTHESGTSQSPKPGPSSSLAQSWIAPDERPSSPSEAPGQEVFTPPSGRSRRSSSTSTGGQLTPRPLVRNLDESALAVPRATSPRHPSALSVLLSRNLRSETSRAKSPEMVPEVDENVVEDIDGSPESAQRASSASQDRDASPHAPSESTPLLSGVPGRLGAAAVRSLKFPPWRGPLAAFGRVRKAFTVEAVKEEALEAVRCLPAVLLGMLLNILDGVSYGMIVFPSNYIFEGFGGLGVSMFFVTTIVAQLTYSCGGSMFGGGNGSMMIEVVPFFNILANQIIQEIGEDNPRSIIATTMVAFALSSILTGLVFLFLGWFRLGALIGFFPRHILVGCIGGIGWFLIETGFEVAGRMESDGFSYTWKTFEHLFLDLHIFLLWFPALALAITIRLITLKFEHQLLFPAFFLLVPGVFYVIVAIIHVDVGTLRNQGWVFDIGQSNEPWYEFYTYFDFRLVSISALWVTMPIQLALLFFNVLHPPLNVPALGVSLGEDDVDTDRELVAHGFSNLFAGLVGTVPNYLVYVNTLMFYRVGGGSRTSGLLLAAGTAVLLIIGTGPIGYIPIMVVGALIFVLGIDLVKEAVWDTRHRVSIAEYFQIVAIILAMTIYDFVVGVLFGIVLSCFFFVLQNSRRRCIRAVYSGSVALSTVRRPPAHRAFLRKVGVQTCIMKLQGFLFFGTISYMEETIRGLLDTASWQHNPIRFLLLDFSFVPGLDFSSGEALIRIHRLLGAKHVILVLCGCPVDSPVARAMQSVGLWTDELPELEVFPSLNEALEWTENAYLRSWLGGSSRKVERSLTDKPIDLPGRATTFTIGTPSENSPRHHHIVSAGETMLPVEPRRETSRPPNAREPFNTLLKVFGSYEADLSDDFFIQVVKYFKPVMLEAGTVLWRQGDEPDGLYIVESGVLKASYSFADRPTALEESMVGGTLMGELSGLSSTPRNATVVADRRCDLWRVSPEDLERMDKEHPDVARLFVKMVLKVTKTEYDALIAACAIL